ncbi:MAG: PqqD family protein [Myxococcota bacterium]
MMSTPAPNPHYRVDPHARFRVLDGEGIFVLQKAGEVLVVNAVGAFIVERLERDMPLDEIIREVSRRYDVDDARAGADARALIDSLLEAGAIQES